MTISYRHLARVLSLISATLLISLVFLNGLNVMDSFSNWNYAAVRRGDNHKPIQRNASKSLHFPSYSYRIRGRYPNYPNEWMKKHKHAFPKVTAISCAILQSNSSLGYTDELKAAKVVMRRGTQKKDTEYLFHDDCEAFKERRGYVTSSLTEEERDFPIAFSILLYKDIHQVERLLRAIYRPQNYYCLHMDSKTKNVDKEAVRTIADCFENVFVASKLVDVVWGAYGVLEAELMCMEDLWKYTKWRYFINLTGQEFPLKTNFELVRILKAYNGSNDIGGILPRLGSDRFRLKVRHKVVDHLVHVTKEKKTPLALNLTYTKGPVHIAASRGFVDFVLHDPRALKFRVWIKDTFVPDETFFSTLNNNPHLNVPGARKGKPTGRKKPYMTRFKLWSPRHTECMGKVVRGLCIFAIGDFHYLVRRPELFVNKLFSNYSPLTYDCLEEWHFKKIVEEYSTGPALDETLYARARAIWNQA